jgi:phosphate-selective porin O/P
MRTALPLLFTCVPGLAAAHVAAQTPAPPPPPPAVTYPNVRITGRVQFQAYALDNGDFAAIIGPTSTFYARRVRVEARGNISERIAFVVQPSYEGGRVSGFRLLDAFLDFRINDLTSRDTLSWRVGSEKRPIGRYELTSSTNLPTIERGAGRGLVRVAANDLFLNNNFLAWDIGTSLTYAAHGKYSLKAGVYNGVGEVIADNNDAKSWGVRATYAILPKVGVGGSFFSGDGIVGTDSSVRHDAYELDLQWGKAGEPGFFALGDYMQGEALDVGRDRMRGITAVASYHHRLGGAHPRFYAIEPAVMIDRGDPNTDVADDDAWLYRAVLGAYLTPRAHVRLSYELQNFADARPSIGGVLAAVGVSW